MSLVRTAALMLLLFTVITGLVYPAVITGIAHVVFPAQASGSLIVEDGRVVGSSAHRAAVRRSALLLGTAVGHGRLSRTTRAASTGSNQGPLNPALHDAVAARIAALRAADPGNDGAGAGRSRHRVGQRPRPAHLARRRVLPGGARGARARHVGGHGALAGRRQTSKDARCGVLGETARQRAALEPGARRFEQLARAGDAIAVDGTLRAPMTPETPTPRSRRAARARHRRKPSASDAPSCASSSASRPASARPTACCRSRATSCARRSTSWSARWRRTAATTRRTPARARNSAAPQDRVPRTRRWKSSTSTRRSRGSPRVLILDELAHTNVPGARHTKRWQDAMELLDAGIDVYTTLNVQHVESLNDVVAQITHVQVRETVPDSVLDRADAIELVDISPEELLARLREGKVYLPDQAHARRRALLPARQSARTARAGAAAHGRASRSGRAWSTANWRACKRRGRRPSASWFASALRPRRVVCCAPRGAWRPGCARRGWRRTSNRSASRPTERSGQQAPRRRTCASRNRSAPRWCDLTGPNVAEAILDYARKTQRHAADHRQADAHALARPVARIAARPNRGRQRRHRRARHRRRRGRTGRRKRSRARRRRPRRAPMGGPRSPSP